MQQGADHHPAFGAVALGLREGDRVVLTRVRQTETPEAPFATFAEWSSDADTAAYAGL